MAELDPTDDSAPSGRLTPEQARAFARRWIEVRAVELEEARALSLPDKLRQLASLMASGDLFSEGERRLEEDEAVRARWIRLKRAAGAGD